MVEATVTPTATLNGGTIDVTVYEDIDNTGTVDNQETITNITSGVTYDLTTFSGGSGNAYWFDTSIDTADVTQTPVLQSVDIAVKVSFPVFVYQNGTWEPVDTVAVFRSI